MSIKITSTGLKKELASLGRQAKALRLPVYVVEQDIGPHRGRTKKKGELIAEVQAGVRKSPGKRSLNRNPWFLYQKEIREIVKILRAGIRKFGKGNNLAVYNSMRSIGAYMRDAMRRHIDEQKNVRGKFNPDLTPAYKKQKQRKHGKVYPILRASDTLYESIRWGYKGRKNKVGRRKRR